MSLSMEPGGSCSTGRGVSCTYDAKNCPGNPEDRSIKAGWECTEELLTWRTIRKQHEDGEEEKGWVKETWLCSWGCRQQGKHIVCVVKSDVRLQLRPPLHARRAGTFPVLGPAGGSCCAGHGATGSTLFCISAPSLSTNICALGVD